MNAVIYCRVSSREQVEGTSLESQESACRDYARRHNLTVQKVFVGQGESAKFADRPELLELLNYCKNRAHKVDMLLVWKIDRFARNVEDHFAIKATLRKYAVNVVSVTEPIQSDPTGRLMETILAGFAQFDNDIRAARAKLGMAHRLREGIWPWMPPLGYLAPKAGRKIHPDRPDPERFEPLRKAWKLFLTGAYTKAAIVRMLRQWDVRGYQGEPITPQTLDQMFANPFYAGVLQDPWSGAEHKGRHQPMISVREFARAQRMIAGRANSVRHNRFHPDFPLRGHVRCPSCHTPMSASYSRGRTKRYAYYDCRNPDCPTLRKSYPAAAVHREFSQFLMQQSVPAKVIDTTLDVVVAASRRDDAESRKAAARTSAQIERLKRQINELVMMRSQQLISDADFVANKQSIQDELDELRANQYEKSVSRLTDADRDGLRGWFGHLDKLWYSLPPQEQSGFATMMLRDGYIFQNLRTAELALLFRTFGPSGGGLSRVVDLDRDTANQLVREIRAFLAIVSNIDESVKDAA